MSKERARRRAEREREQAIRAAARAREAERRQRRASRSRALTGWIPRPRWKPGLLARRRRRELAATAAIVLGLDVALWIARPDWEARLMGVIVSILVAPVLHTMLFRRR